MNIVICQNELDILRWSLYFHFNSIHLFKMSVIIMKLNLPSFDSRRTLVKWNAFPSSESNQQTKDVLLFTYFFLSMALFSGCKNIQRIVISILLIFLIRLHFLKHCAWLHTRFAIIKLVITIAKFINSYKIL